MYIKYQVERRVAALTAMEGGNADFAGAKIGRPSRQLLPALFYLPTSLWVAWASRH